MMTMEQRRKLQSQLSPEEQSIANIGRLAKAAVLGLLVVGLTLLGAADKNSNDLQQAAAPAMASDAYQAGSTAPATRQ